MDPKRLFTAAALALLMGYSLLLFRVVKSDSSWSEDFTAFYTGWTIARSPDRADLYDLETQRTYQAQILAQDGHDSSVLQGGLLPYLNPPHISILFVPLSLLPRQTAFLVWMFVQLGLLALLWKPVKELTDQEYRWTAIVAILAFPLIVGVIGIGALSVLVMVAIIRADYALRKERAIEAAFWLTLATTKPQMVLFPLVALLIIYRLRLLIPLSLMVFALCASSLALTGIHPFVEYPRLLSFVTNSPGQLSILVHTTATLRGVLFSIFGYANMRVVNPISSLAMIVGLFGVAWLWLRGIDRDLGLSLTILLGLFLGLHVNPADDVLLIFPALLLYWKLRSPWLAGFLMMWPFVMFVEWRLTNGRPFNVSLNTLVVGLLVLSIIKLRPALAVKESSISTLDSRERLLGQCHSEPH